MTQTLDGELKSNDMASYTHDVAVWRKAIGNWNFTDDTGAQAAYTLFTVTGTVALTCHGVCQTALTVAGGVPTIEVGIAGNTAAIIAQTTSTDLDRYETWKDIGPETNPGAVPVFGDNIMKIPTNGADVIFTVGGSDLTAGDVDFYAMWLPLSADGNVVGL